MLSRPFRSRPVLLDGAQGTWLAAHGAAAGVPACLACLDRPDLVRACARDYARAGADVVTANSFAASEAWLAGTAGERRGPELVRLAVRLAREGAAGRCRVAVSLGPVRAAGDVRPPSVRSLAAPLLSAAAREDPDLVLLESQISVRDAIDLVRLAREMFPAPVPILAGFTLREDGRTVDGERPERAAALLVEAGADAPGANCGGGPVSLLEPVRRMAAAGGAPVWAKPSAGLPDESGSYPIDDGQFARGIHDLVRVGAAAVGGCCGTTPATIAALSRALRLDEPGVRAGAD